MESKTTKEVKKDLNKAGDQTEVFTCSYCGKKAKGKPIESGFNQFCSYSCHKNHHEYYNDNCYSDADPGL